MTIDNSTKVSGKLIVFYGPETEEKELQIARLHEKLVQSNFKSTRYFFPEIFGEHTEKAVENILREHCFFVSEKLLPENDFVITNGYIGNFIVEMLHKDFSEDEILAKFQSLDSIFSGKTISFFIDFSERHKKDSLKKGYSWCFERSADICEWEFIDGEFLTNDEISKEVFDHLLPMLHEMNLN